MKISDITTQKQLDELDAGQAGHAAGSGVRAVGAGVGNFAKGFAQGLMGKKPEPKDTTASAGTDAKPAAGAAPKGASAASGAGQGSLDTIKDAISKLSPKQRAAIRTQIAKKAGVK
jgi:hypothetical protein